MSRPGYVLCAAALLLYALTAGAEPPPAAPPSVRVSVVAILASETDATVDRRLECIAREVRKMNPKLIGFRCSTMSCKVVPVNTEENFDLVADQAVRVKVEKGTDKDSRVQLKVTPPLMGEITYDACCGKFLPILTRYRTDKNSDVLILAIRVQACQAAK
jgi:hypothetical protein